jgi:hypothetical protein
MNVHHLFRHMFIIIVPCLMFPPRLNWGAILYAPKGFPPPHPIWSQCTSDIHFLMDRDGDLPYILVFRTWYSPYAALRLCTLFLLGTASCSSAAELATSLLFALAAFLVRLWALLVFFFLLLTSPTDCSWFGHTFEFRRQSYFFYTTFSPSSSSRDCRFV